MTSETEARIRQDSDALLNWPARVAADIAAAVGVEERIMHRVLDQCVRTFMRERSMLPVVDEVQR